ncbi:MAG TPA: O-antigen ligase family protein [Pseudonocardiaceae bacterium]|nr:O-antigen ligase family protein [Pseudonocardiaceae bacterium]
MPVERTRREYWPIVCVLAFVVASDYKFRLRANNDTIQGQADIFVVIEVATYALIAAFLFWRFKPTFRLRRADAVTYLGYAYIVVCVGSALYSPYHALALVRAGQMVVVLAFARSVARHADPAAPHRIAHAYAVLIAGSTIFGVLVPYPKLPSQPGRFTWLYIHPVEAGMLLAIAVIILTAYLLGSRVPRNGPRWHLGVYAALWLICVAGLLATGTRGAALGAVVGIVVVVATRWRGIRKLEIALLGGIALGGVALALGPQITAFVARGESAAQLATLNFRTDLWSQALADFAQHPLYGFGFTADRGLFLDTTGLGGGHNAIINLLVDTGLVGTAVWFALLIGIGVTAYRLRPRGMATDRGLVLALLVGMFANSMFTDELGAPANAMCTWLFVLLAWVGILRGARERSTARSGTDLVTVTR